MRQIGSPIRPKDRLLVFGALPIEGAEIQEVVASLRSGWLGTGPKVARFENDFRAYKGAERAVAVNCCTAALHLSILAAGVQLGDEVISTALTFCATVLTYIGSFAPYRGGQHSLWCLAIVTCVRRAMTFDRASPFLSNDAHASTGTLRRACTTC